ncbi:MAG: hypothetical protein WCL14_10020 [Bacteroidota bacterium]
MKDKIVCLREFDGLPISEQSGYLVRHGYGLTLNAARFPEIPYDGATITAHGETLNKAYGLRNIGEAQMDAYAAERTLTAGMMDENYAYIDAVSGGNGEIVAEGGVHGSSSNTTRTPKPSRPMGTRYVFVDGAGEMRIEWDLDKLSWIGIVLTFTDVETKVEVSGPKQIRVTNGAFVYYMDFVSGSKTVIRNLSRGMRITSKVALFNPNGLSPISTVEPITVPR